MNPAEGPPAHVTWLPWSGDAFARALREDKPVLLWLTAAWSDGCREMARVCFGDPEIVRALRDECIAVRVDADERPDVAERYSLGGIPTTVFLTASGEVLGGGTFVPADSLRAALSRVRHAQGGAVPVSVREPGDDVSAASIPPGVESLTGLVLDAFDRANGGTGQAPKFPHTSPVRLVLDLYIERRDPALLDVTAAALDAMALGALYDEEDGGFFRYCEAPDWTSPRREKLLSVNASLLELYSTAGSQLQHAGWLERARDVARFIDRRLRRHDGLWRNSAHEEASRVFTDVNALTASAMLAAADAIGEAPLASSAIESFERLLLATYRPGDGVAHFAGGPRGLLVDQVSAVRACLDAYDASARLPYRMMAEELVHFAVRTMWDGEGGFVDRTRALADEDPHAATRPLKPFVHNCELAIQLRRLADVTEDSAFTERARDTLHAMHPHAAAHGALAAQYLIAHRAVFR
jgi:uncharacterized protein YyaL (SSP411 family)